MKNNKKATFWTKTNKSNVVVYVINPSELKTYLELVGFCKFKLNDQDKIIHLENGISKEVTPQEIFNATLKYVETFNNPTLTNAFYRQGDNHLLTKKAVLGSLKTTPLSPVRDGKDNSYLFYQNCFVEIRSNSDLQLFDYSRINNLNGFIWEKSILKRNFIENIEESVFEQFLKKVTNDDEHFKSVICAIGYLLHSFKNPSITKVIIISDENTEAENKANGGTGKGIIVSAIQQFINIASQNGKNIDLSNNRFVFQNVCLNTGLIYLDDVKKDFEFEQLFTVITNDMIVEQKNKPSFTIPFEISPKIVITTNYRINGNSSSHNRRKYLIFINNYFSDLYTPNDEFKHIFFKEWSVLEWNKFDTFMISCIKEYLSFGLIDYKLNQELKLKKLKQEIDPHIFDLLETKCNELNKFYPLKITNLSNSKQVFLYAEYKGYDIKTRQVLGCKEFKFITK